MRKLEHYVDFCVVGGGMSGICAAIAAARHGAKVMLIHDRPVLGGNASSEIRMWVCGAHGENNKETGILEEIQLENIYRNPLLNYSIWDSVLYEKVKAEENITLLLNCSCNSVETDGNSIKSVKAWQLTNETEHIVHADYFADCSGDSILAPLTGAKFRVGRESRNEFGESIAPLEADKKTMGMSCLFQIRETDRPQKFIPPSWAYSYPTEEDLPYKDHSLDNNYWWIEVGGEHDSIHDTEELRDELLKIAFGVWDHIKNHGDHGADNWVMDWIGFLPGKRESRRYVGDHILTQNDIESEGKFDDIIAYGGWSMDDHYPAGFYHQESYPTIFHPAPSPYGIPYRCLYSKNIENLFFAGRNISATHSAMSSTRVMGTCAILGQAVGTAAAIAVKESISPREVYQKHMLDLQEQLMEDDCYLPWQKKSISKLYQRAEIIGENDTAGLLRNGIDRKVGDDENAYQCRQGSFVDFVFEQQEQISEISIVFDSDLSRHKRMLCAYPQHQEPSQIPDTIVKDYDVLVKNEAGEWETLVHVDNNYQRRVIHELKTKSSAIRIRFNRTWGADEFRVFSVYIK